MADMDYDGEPTMNDLNVSRGYSVYIKNDTDVSISVTWPAGIFTVEPNGDETVQPNSYSTSHTIRNDAQISTAIEHTVWAKPPDTANLGIEIPVAGSGNIFIVG